MVSPHVLTIRERFQINGELLEVASFETHLENFLSRLDSIGDMRVSYFEVTTALAFWIFEREQVECAVVEVGLGGLIDPTNTITRPDKIGLISAISLDHTEILGDTVEEIASEKAGIAQPANCVYVIEQSSSVLSTIESVAVARGAEVRIVPVQGEARLPGNYDRRNHLLAAAGAAHALEQLGRASDATPGPVLPAPVGRFDFAEVAPGSGLLVDGAHNQDELRALGARIASSQLEDFRIALAFTDTTDEKLAGMLDAISSMGAPMAVTAYRSRLGGMKRAADPLRVGAIAADRGIRLHIEPSAPLAFQWALEGPSPKGLVAGSLYLAAEAIVWADERTRRNA
ncbi:folylpolyglutamate synthase/dihydrofolate synthase family protein [Promicromonospora sukumoe]|uniref:Dihydrofolate synthase/folylpolyglutamate synthase n=2 Tax=Promicromonospora sukumoe TaxID=88382 RepID=A0A7W3J4Y4_9MICO|nr:dihydrofolate synthase/folylpolyglutamate synthase [Promicromonospora sukumoe]